MRREQDERVCECRGPEEALGFQGESVRMGVDVDTGGLTNFCEHTGDEAGSGAYGASITRCV